MEGESGAQEEADVDCHEQGDGQVEVEAVRADLDEAMTEISTVQKQLDNEYL